MVVPTVELDVDRGDVVEIEGRRYEVVPDRQSGLTFERAIIVGVGGFCASGTANAPPPKRRSTTSSICCPWNGEGVAMAGTSWAPREE